MLLSIPASDFADPAPRSREHSAIVRAIEIEPDVRLMDQFDSERWYRVQAKGRDRHAVIIWFGELSEQDECRCDCPAFMLPVTGPTPCLHIAAVLIFEATQPEQKQVTMKNHVAAPRLPPRVDDVPLGCFYCKACQKVVRSRHRCPRCRKAKKRRTRICLSEFRGSARRDGECRKTR